MNFRVARHTKDMEAIKRFYIDLLGFDLLGIFKGHDGYDGIFIGREGLDWHLEFTVSDHAPQHKADDDDLLVFYCSGAEEFNKIVERAIHIGVPGTDARNPYWNKKGKTYTDPDGFRVVVVEHNRSVK